MSLITLVTVIAEGAAPAGQNGGGLTQMLIPVLLMVGILYLLVFRPQRRRERQRQQMLAQVKKSDHVVTIGGIHGVVMQIRGDDVVLKVDESNNVKMTFTRSAIARVIEKSGEAGEGAEKGDVKSAGREDKS
jgi:preprotein translocase subunit YajC